MSSSEKRLHSMATELEAIKVRPWHCHTALEDRTCRQADPAPCTGHPKAQRSKCIMAPSNAALGIHSTLHAAWRCLSWPAGNPTVRNQARCAEVEAERNALAETAGVTPEHCRAAKAQLFEAAKLCASPHLARPRTSCCAAGRCCRNVHGGLLVVRHF